MTQVAAHHRRTSSWEPAPAPSGAGVCLADRKAVGLVFTSDRGGLSARVALGPKSGSAVERLGRRRGADRPLFMPGERCCDIEQFSLHAKVRIEAHDREGLERLCRYIARPPVKVERLSLDPDGRVIYALRRP